MNSSGNIPKQLIEFLAPSISIKKEKELAGTVNTLTFFFFLSHTHTHTPWTRDGIRCPIKLDHLIFMSLVKHSIFWGLSGIRLFQLVH